jgi:hypothetical protein
VLVQAIEHAKDGVRRGPARHLGVWEGHDLGVGVPLWGREGLLSWCRLVAQRVPLRHERGQGRRHRMGGIDAVFVLLGHGALRGEDQERGVVVFDGRDLPPVPEHQLVDPLQSSAENFVLDQVGAEPLGAGKRFGKGGVGCKPLQIVLVLHARRFGRSPTATARHKGREERPLFRMQDLREEDVGRLEEGCNGRRGGRGDRTTCLTQRTWATCRPCHREDRLGDGRSRGRRAFGEMVRFVAN